MNKDGAYKEFKRSKNFNHAPFVHDIQKEFIRLSYEPLSLRPSHKFEYREHSLFESQMNSNFHSNQASKLSKYYNIN